MIAADLRSKVGDLRQFASVRRITLDDGVEHGVRALAFSSGGGLDFWVLTDRSLDIGPLWWKGLPVAWQSMAGFRSPALHHPEEDDGRGYGRTSSGFVVTCGLDHIRQPVSGHPLHGRLPFTPARVTAHGEDWDRAEPVLYCEGEVMQFRFQGEALRLRRRIEVPIGGCEIRFIDVVENLGATASPQACLYHFNLGYPAVTEGTTLHHGAKKLLTVPALPDPKSDTESVSYPAGDGPRAVCTVSTPGVGDVVFDFATATLPHLQIWHDLRPHAGVLSIEPCTSAKIGGTEKILNPGERRDYHLRVAFNSRQ